jgi:hypothetical protein
MEEQACCTSLLLLLLLTTSNLSPAWILANASSNCSSHQ